MFWNNTPSRRNILKTGIASLAAGITTAKKTYADLRPKAPGETKVVYLGGDQLHNGYGQEYYLRKTFRQVNWRLLFTTDARYVTPDLIKDADLLIIHRWMGEIPGWVPEPVVEKRTEKDGFLTDELANAIADNVINRGMGFISLHATILCVDKPPLGDLLGVKPQFHGAFQNIRIHSLNPGHPITSNILKWKQIDGSASSWDRELTNEKVTEFVFMDENFGAAPTNDRVVTLFKSTGMEDNREDNAGWCIEQGKGRVVGLCAGHTSDQFIDPSNRQIQFRAAHWAMKRDIPSYEGALDHI